MTELMTRFPQLSGCRDDIEKTIDVLIETFVNGHKLLLCGNGGSCADCDHIVGELMKGFKSLRPMSREKREKMKKNNPQLSDNVLSKLQLAVPAISLPSLTALNSAFCNDVDPELVYAQELMGLGREDDVLICLSTSGNSKNCVAAAQVARGLGMTVISLTGNTGGRLKELSNICICAPETETYKVQELHLPIYHHICAEVEKRYIQDYA